MAGPMTSDEMFARSAQLRRELADLTETLTPDELATPSPCGGWDVRTVIAHLTVLATVSKPAFAAVMLRSRGDIGRTIDTLSRRAARQSPAELAATLRRIAPSRATPPMLGAAAPLTDLVVHTSDVLLPLGRPWTPAAADTEVALDFLAGNPIGFFPRSWLSGVQLVATDLDRTWRDGAELRGTAADLLLALFARPGALDRVAGPGRELLVSRR